MTERELAQRLHDLCVMADRFRMPDHRRTVETCMADRDEIRNGLRRCYRELTGSWPAHEGQTAGTAGTAAARQAADADRAGPPPGPRPGAGYGETAVR